MPKKQELLLKLTDRQIESIVRNGGVPDFLKKPVNEAICKALRKTHPVAIASAEQQQTAFAVKNEFDTSDEYKRLADQHTTEAKPLNIEIEEAYSKLNALNSKRAELHEQHMKQYLSRLNKRLLDKGVTLWEFTNWGLLSSTVPNEESQEKGGWVKMAVWLHKLPEFKQILEKNDDADNERESVTKTKTELIDFMRKQKCFDSIPALVMQGLSQADTFHSFNQALNKVYDFCDAHAIWLGI